MNESNTGRWLFCFLLGFTSLCYAGHGSSVDENLIVQVIYNFVHDGELTVAQMFQALPAEDGKYYSRYGFGYPLLLLPFFLLAKLLHTWIPESPAYCGNIYMFVMLWTSTLNTAFLGWLFYKLCLLIGGKSNHAAILSLGLIICTSFLPYSQTLYRLTASGTLLVGVLYLILRYEQNGKKINLLWIALLTALGLNIREDLVIGLLWIGVYCLFIPNLSKKLWASNAVFWGAVLGMMLWGGHNFIRFGSVYVENYADVHLNYPLIISVPQLLWGYKRGIITYSPLCLLLLFSIRHGLIQQKIKLYLLCVLIFTTYLFLYGKSDFWHGGVCFGPRHMYFALPFAFLPGIWFMQDNKRWKLYLISLLGLCGFIMNLPGVYAHPGKYQSFFDAPSFFSLLMKPPESLDYVGFDDLDLWWLRMMKIDFTSIWTVLFLIILMLTTYSGYCLYQCIMKERINPQQ
jgi:hypothetical protein